MPSLCSWLVVLAGASLAAGFPQVAEQRPREIARPEGHAAMVHAVGFSPDGRSLLTASQDKTLRLWEVVTGKERQEFRGHTEEVTAVAFSPRGRLVASSSADKTVRLWDAATGRERAILRGHEMTVYAVAFSPDGKRLATDGCDNTIRLWDPATGKELRRFDGSPGGRRSSSNSTAGR